MSETMAPAGRRPDLWLPGFAAAALLVSFLVSPEGLPRFPICFFKNLTGLDCPGCGLTRSFCSLSHGRLADAWRFHPFGILFYALAWGLALSPVVRRLLPPRAPRRPAPSQVPLLLVASMTLLWALRLARVLP